MSTAIIIPTIDEIDGIIEILPQINKQWAETMVFVDGGSTDGTVEKAQEMGFDVIHQHN